MLSNIILRSTAALGGAPFRFKKCTALTSAAGGAAGGSVAGGVPGALVWESLDNTTDLLSITTGDLEVSTKYKFRARQKGQVYGYSSWVETTITTAAMFTPTIGIQGKKGFSVAPTDQPFALLGLAEMTGTNDPTSDNYGNYIHTNVLS